ncbi:MAG: hypothetical protein II387_04280, partial [Oscillospiraceae bacterium]|nr:hypothetical protein [Oscillospiraceae bacterium]
NFVNTKFANFVNFFRRTTKYGKAGKKDANGGIFARKILWKPGCKLLFRRFFGPLIPAVDIGGGI